MLAPISERDHELAALYGTQLNLRAVLSKGYKIIDHAAVLDVVLPIAHARNARVAEYNLSEKYFHVRLTTVDRPIREIAAAIMEERGMTHAHQRDEHGHDMAWINEVVGAGLALRNSETGHGAYSMAFALKILRCLNLLVSDQKQRIIHVGGRKKEDEAYFTTKTRRLDDAATLSKIRDMTTHLLSERYMQEQTLLIGDAAGEQLPVKPEEPVMEFVGNVGKRFDLTEKEVEILQDEFASEAVTTGLRLDETNRWTLSQAMTATARRLHEQGNGDAIDFERKSEIETAGWKILKDPVTALVNA